MGETHDFEKLRKKRRRGILLRRTAIMLAVLLAVLGVLSLNNVLVEFGSAGRMSDFLRGFGGDGYPIPVPGGILRNICALGNDLVLLNDTNLYIFNERGKETLNIQHASETAILLTGGGRTMIYDIGGMRYRIYSRSKLLVDKKSEFTLTTAAMNEQGDFALVSSTKQYAAQVTVYDAKSEQKFQWSSSELVASVAIGPQGDKMAAGCVGASGGILNSSILLFSFDTESAVARLEIPDELAIQVSYLNESFVGILTDKGYHVMDQQGREVATSVFGGEHLVAGRTNAQGDTLLLTESTEARTQTVCLIDSSGLELGRIQPHSAVRDMQVSSKGVYLLTDNGLERYDRAFNLEEAYTLSEANRILLTDNRIYYFTAEEICVLE